MSDWVFDITFGTGISLIAIISLVLVILGLPGTWVIVAISAVMTFYFDGDHPAAMRLTTFWILVGLACFGELLEFIAGAMGVNKLGGARRSAFLAIVGSIIGAIAGLFIGTPVPVIGSVVVSLLLGGAGAFAGAVLGELWVGKNWDEAIQIGNAAFWGRMFGTLGKIVCAATMACVLIGAAWLR